MSFGNFNKFIFQNVPLFQVIYAVNYPSFQNESFRLIIHIIHTYWQKALPFRRITASLLLKVQENYNFGTPVKNVCGRLKVLSEN